MDKVLSKFNKTTGEMISDLQSVYPELTEQCQIFTEKYKIDDADSREYIRYFYNNVYIFSEQIAKKDVSFFENVAPLDNVDLKFLVSDSSHKNNLEIVWKYMDTLYLYGFKYIKLLTEMNETLNDSEAIVKNLKTMGFDQEFFDNQSKLLSKMIENMQTKTGEPSEDGTGATSAPKLPPEMEVLAEKLFGGALGSLAKEIASEVDTTKLNIDLNNPQNLLKSLVSGENKDLMNLVTNVSTKLQTKIERGEVNQQALMAEATTIMEDLQKMKDIPGLDPNLFSGLNSSGFNPAAMMGMMNMMGSTNKKPSNPENLKLLPKNHPKRRNARK
jgi:hypothetical protein